MNYLIDFKADTTPVNIASYLQLQGLSIVRHFDKLNNVYLVSGDQLPTVTDIVDKVIEDDPQGIQLLDVTQTLDNAPSGSKTFNTADDSAWWKVASFNNIEFNSPTQTFDVRGKKSIIYLVDSGIDSSHSEFVNANIVNLFSFNDDFADVNGHGTALASIMVGETCGITAATVKSVKIFDSRQPTLLSDLIAAFDAILADYISNGQRSSFVNLSWGISKNEYINEKINLLIDYGIIVVASAGNDGSAIGDVTPAGIERVITVGAYNQDLLPCDFSNFTGETIISNTEGPVNSGALDGWAPGVKILTASLLGGLGYSAGTSSAAAITTAALVYNYDVYVDDETGTVPSTLRPANAATIVFSRRDLLTLDGQYANSPNRVCTVLVDYNSTLTSSLSPEAGSISEVLIPVEFNKYFRRRLFNPYVYDTITYSNLPNGLSIVNGFILGTLTKTTENNSEQYIINATISNSAESLKFIITITGITDIQQFIDDQGSFSSLTPDFNIDITLHDCFYSPESNECIDIGCDYYCSVDGYYSGGYCYGNKNFCSCQCF